MTGRRGLVLGGGGVTGIAWETGLLAGLLEAGVDLTSADLVVGTSAGSVVGAQLMNGTPLSELYARQLEPPVPVPGPVPRLGGPVLLGYAWAMLRARGNAEELGRLLGQWSVRRTAAGRTPSLARRYDAIRDRLPALDWPSGGRLVITAVDAETGRLRCFDGSDGVSLLDAVAASCAVPGVYPPVPIEGRPYVDGGARSAANADLARDCAGVVALTPLGRAMGPMRSARQQLEGVPRVLVAPDAAARAAIGRNVLDPAARVASARAGYAQAAAVAPEVAALWS
jgi:NTE family protein